MLFQNSHFEIRVLHRVSDIDPNDWDKLSGQRPFQSYRWYQYGEWVMSDCRPTYILLYRQGELVARASLWLIRNEPLPLPPGMVRNAARSALNHWPLLICRSPLSFLSGLILPELPLRDPALGEICRVARDELRSQHASFLVFDYMEAKDEEWTGWPREFTFTAVSDPGTIMHNRWDDLESYFASGNKKDRQHYKRSMREAQAIGIKTVSVEKVSDVETTLALIQLVEKRHGSPSNPWAKAMLENLEMINGICIEAYMNEKLVGCGLIFEDNRVQLTATLGLADHVPGVYFQLIYASLQDAFKRKVRSLRWGSGAYDVKRRLGFELETNNNSVFISGNPFVNFIMQNLVKVLL
jgi:predicted N-acyltransferase